MVIVDATLVATNAFRSRNQIVSFQYTAPSIVAGWHSDDIRLAIEQGGEGKLIALRVACGSTNFDISLRTEFGITPPSIREILRVEDNVERYDGTSLDIYYWNPDEEDYLYLVLENTDDENDTGELYIELIISRM